MEKATATITLTELAALLHCTPTHVRRLLKTRAEQMPRPHRLPGERRIFFVVTDVQKWLAGLSGEPRKLVPLTDHKVSPDFLRLKIGGLEHEAFCVAFLDSRHRIIAFEEMFRGPLHGASLHPREVLKASLKHNATAVIFAHNHTSGVAEPFDADCRLTLRLKDALALIGVQVLDHFVVGGGKVTSLKERGRL